MLDGLRGHGVAHTSNVLIALRRKCALGSGFSTPRAIGVRATATASRGYPPLELAPIGHAGLDGLLDEVPAEQCGLEVVHERPSTSQSGIEPLPEPPTLVDVVCAKFTGLTLDQELEEFQVRPTGRTTAAAAAMEDSAIYEYRPMPAVPAAASPARTGAELAAPGLTSRSSTGLTLDLALADFEILPRDQAAAAAGEPWARFDLQVVGAVHSVALPAQFEPTPRVTAHGSRPRLDRKVSDAPATTADASAPAGDAPAPQRAHRTSHTAAEAVLSPDQQLALLRQADLSLDALEARVLQLRACSLFESASLWPDTVMLQLAAACERVRVRRFKHVYRFGAPADSVYVVLSGQVVVRMLRLEPVALSAGALFGEAALLAVGAHLIVAELNLGFTAPARARRPSVAGARGRLWRPDDVECTEPCELLRLSADAVAHLKVRRPPVIGPSQSVARVLARAAISRWTCALVLKISLFRAVSAAKAEALAELFTPRVCRPGEVVLHRGAPGYTFFMIVTGAVKVTLPGDNGAERVLRVLEHTDTSPFFGEAALKQPGAPRSADVVASEATVLLAAGHESRQLLLELHPTFDEHFRELRRHISATEPSRRAARAALEPAHAAAQPPPASTLTLNIKPEVLLNAHSEQREEIDLGLTRQRAKDILDSDANPVGALEKGVRQFERRRHAQARALATHGAPPTPADAEREPEEQVAQAAGELMTGPEHALLPSSPRSPRLSGARPSPRAAPSTSARGRRTAGRDALARVRRPRSLRELFARSGRTALRLRAVIAFLRALRAAERGRAAARFDAMASEILAVAHNAPSTPPSLRRRPAPAHPSAAHQPRAFHTAKVVYVEPPRRSARAVAEGSQLARGEGARPSPAAMMHELVAGRRASPPATPMTSARPAGPLVSRAPATVPAPPHGVAFASEATQAAVERQGKDVLQSHEGWKLFNRTARLEAIWAEQLACDQADT